MVLQVAPTEMKDVVSAYTDSKDVKSVQSNGFHIAGNRYVTIKADDRSLYGKKVIDQSLASSMCATDPL